MSILSGEWAALVAALLWSIAAVIFSGFAGRVSPLGLNLLKGCFAIGYLSLTLAVAPAFGGGVISSGTMTSWILLLLSGAIGIGVGDTFYFEALHAIGPRKTLLLKVLAPAISAVLAWATLRETLRLQDALGIGITIVGVAWVISERTPVVTTSELPLHTASQSRGVMFALFAAITEAIGAVMSRMAFLNTGIDPLWSTWLRLVGGAIVVIGMLFWQQTPVFLGDRKGRRKLLLITLGVAFFSTYLGIWLQQIALKSTAAAIAQTLSATSPLFVLVITALQGKAVSGRSIGGAIAAVFGIWVLLN
jgi:drug/metabolite transporter (DMT)-like permease